MFKTSFFVLMPIINRLLFLSIFLFKFQLFGQNPIDSLKLVIANVKTDDTTRVLAMDQLSLKLMNSNLGLALDYGNKGLKLAKKIDFDKGKVRLLNRLAFIYTRANNFSLSLKTAYLAIDLAKKINDEEGLGKIYNNMSIFYSVQNDYQKALEYDRKVKDISIKLKNNSLFETALLNMGVDFISLKQLDSAKFYLEKIYKIQQKDKSANYQYLTLQNLANINFKQKDYKNAISNYRICIQKFEESKDYIGLSQTSFFLGEVYKEVNKIDSCIYFAKKAYDLGDDLQITKLKLDAAKLLSDVYEKNNINEAFKYFKLSAIAKDSLFNTEKIRQLHLIELQEKIRIEQIEESEKEYNSKLRFGLLLGLLGALLIFGIVQYRNNIQKNSINIKLQKQKAEIEEQKDQLHESFETLKTTQKQLVLRDKLASLGELTAGIAHEIQNPLNFVNNFSEVNTELIQEVLDEQRKPFEKRDNELENSLLVDLKNNQEKISHHGNRASSIVKAMLEHSRNSNGQKTVVNLNELIDEFLKLSYLSIKAKFKEFNSDIDFTPDEKLPKISAVSQDIGRVFLNLFNNGFYALNERSNKIKDSNYKPKLTVATKFITENIAGSIKSFVEISIQDNGIGMKDEIKDKVLQPFFTTKPTGEGTGLGLSLTNDIIVKGHNGSLLLNTEFGEGTTFKIKLPIE